MQLRKLQSETQEEWDAVIVLSLAPTARADLREAFAATWQSLVRGDIVPFGDCFAAARNDIGAKVDALRDYGKLKQNPILYLESIWQKKAISF